MTTMKTTSPILVTGATGYVAGWIVKGLLESGATVHAAVRDPKNKEKVKYLDSIAEKAPGDIHYFESDLLREGSYRDAMAGCELVFHTASPFTTNIEDPQRELVDPAVNGTRNVLEQANRTESVRRLVLTSSVAAIYGDTADVEKTRDGRLTEEHWNETSSLEHQPYSFSKTLAEREAWSIAKAQSRWDLVVINPSLVIGPGVNPMGTSESFNLIRQLGNGTMKTGVPNFCISVVDVRDVAQAHIQAAFRREAKGRYIISAVDTNFPEMGRVLSQHFGNAYSFPPFTLPKWLVWLVAPMVKRSLTRRMVSRNVDHPIRCDNGKSIQELGLSYRPMKDSLVDFFQQMIDHGLV